MYQSMTSALRHSEHFRLFEDAADAVLRFEHLRFRSAVSRPRRREGDELDVIIPPAEARNVHVARLLARAAARDARGAYRVRIGFRAVRDGKAAHEVVTRVFIRGGEGEISRFGVEGEIGRRGQLMERFGRGGTVFSLAILFFAAACQQQGKTADGSQNAYTK